MLLKKVQVQNREISGWVEPVSVFARLHDVPGAILLESQAGSVGGRFSLICFNPFGTLVTHGQQTYIESRGKVSVSDDSPFDATSKLLACIGLHGTAGIVFPGGAVGYFGYELGRFIEKMPTPVPDDIGVPDCWLGFYNCAAVFDQLEKRITISVLTSVDFPRPEESFETVERLIAKAVACPDIPFVRPVYPELVESSFSKEQFCLAVSRVKEYIAQGEIYQANISQRFKIAISMTPWEMYLRLRDRNPAPYAAFVNLGDAQIVSSSPECFLQYNPLDRSVKTQPIKGTRPRGHDIQDDERLRMNLATSEKDRAENVMIVDLERNDLGKVCEYGSVEVPELFVVESHPTVHHLVSTVKGRLRSDCDAIDLLTACFPGGSITGAPKIRAMEIIREIEPVRRGVYTGSIGWIGFDGSVNLNIAIRTAVIKDGLCYFHVGGGIVADSDPEAEYFETLDKGRAFLEVLGCYPSACTSGE